jgi:PLD-like domain
MTTGAKRASCGRDACQRWLGGLSEVAADHDHQSEFEVLIDDEIIAAWRRDVAGLSVPGSCLMHASWYLDDINVAGGGGASESQLSSILSQLAASGVDLRIRWSAAVFLPSSRRFYRTMRRQYPTSIQRAKPGTWIGSSHEKFTCMVRADEAVAFVSSADLNWNRLDNSDHDPENRSGYRAQSSSPTHEAAARVTGPTAERLAAHFFFGWRSTASDDAEMPAVPAVTHQFGDDTPGQVCHLLRTEPRLHRLRRHRVGSKRTQIHEALLHAINESNHYIYFEDQFFFIEHNRSTGDALGRALQNAIGRGVTVIVVASPDGSNGPWKSLVRRSLRLDGMRRLGSAAAASSCNGGFVVATPNPQTSQEIHSKLAIFDDEYAIVGSANIAARSWETDSEVALGLLPASDEIKHLRTKLWSHHLGIDSEDVPWATDVAADWFLAALQRSHVLHEYDWATASILTAILPFPPFRQLAGLA